MAVDIELAVNLMQAQHRGLALVRYAPDLSAYPTALDTPLLPCLLTWPGPGSWGQKGHGYKFDTRTMQVMGFCEPIGQSDLPTRAIEAVQLLQQVRSFWSTAADLSLDTGATSGYQITVKSAFDNPHADDGIGPQLTMGGKTYHGFILRVAVAIQWIVA